VQKREQSATWKYTCSVALINMCWYEFVEMYRLNSVSRFSRCVLSNINFICSDTRRNAHIYKNIFVKSTRLCTRIERYRFNDRHKSQDGRSKMLFAVSLPTLIFHYLLGIEDTDEEVPEVIMTIKRSVLLIQVKYWDLSYICVQYLYKNRF